MQKLVTLTFFLVFFIYSPLLFAQVNSRLRVQDPRAGFRSDVGQIDSAAFTIKPQGLYAEVGMYLTYSSKGTNLTGAKDTLEVQHYFSLPKGTVVADSWLWFKDIIIRAKILDRWTASRIYNQIVGLRQDPSILLKNSPTNYEFRIYPMAGNETRRVKLTFLIPMRWQNNQTYVDLPVNILLTNGTLPTLNVRVFEQADWKNPRITEYADFKFANQIDTLGKTLGGNIDLNKLRSTGKLSIVYDSPIKNGVYASVLPTGTNEGYYQLLLFPNQVANLSLTAQNLLVAVDYNAGNTSVEATVLLNQIKENLRNTLAKKDSFNLIFSRLTPQVIGDKWFAASKLDSVFNTLNSGTISNISNLPTVLAQSMAYLKAKKSGKLILFSSDASFMNTNSANEMIAELKKIANPLPPTYILDFSDRHSIGFSAGNFWYYGNAYLYNNLARQSGGENYDVDYEDNITDLVQKNFQSAIGTFDNLELYTTTEDGFCHARFNLDDGSHTFNTPLLQVGKYQGKLPFRIELSGSYGANIFTKKIALPVINIDTSKNSLSVYWGAQHIFKLENGHNYDNASIQQLIDLSFKHRVLTQYTAFLALEPAQGGEACQNCDNSKVVTKVEELPEQPFGLSASPNPFTNETSIKITFAAWQSNSKAQLTVYDIWGRMIKTFIVDIKSGDTEVNVQWETDTLPPGMYIVKFTAENKQQTIKLVKM